MFLRKTLKDVWQLKLQCNSIFRIFVSTFLKLRYRHFFNKKKRIYIFCSLFWKFFIWWWRHSSKKLIWKFWKAIWNTQIPHIHTNMINHILVCMCVCKRLYWYDVKQITMKWVSFELIHSFKFCQTDSNNTTESVINGYLVNS